MNFAVSGAVAVAVVVGAPWLASAGKSKLAVLPTQFDETSRGQVPSLFDDYLLTAVQNVGDEYEVIGQDDIAALLGFEKQRDLLDCSDTSCMADIGGALGVDRLVSMKIARLGQDWVATGKLINIRATKVEARVNEIVSGDVKALLRSVPGIVAKLFGQAPPPTVADTPAAPPPVASTPAPQPTPSAPITAPKPQGPDESKGKALRIVGTIMLFGGGGLAVIGGLLCTFSNSELGVNTGSATSDDSLNILLGVYGTLFLIAGFVVEGVGAKLRVMGAAKAALGTEKATGTPALYWMGWVLAGMTIAWPVVSIVDELDPLINVGIGWGLGLGAGLVFLIGGFGDGDPELTASVPLPTPTVTFARTGPDTLTPMYGLGLNW